MTQEDESNGRIIPDLLNMRYEYLFRTIGKGGKLSLELKCLLLVLILYVPGLITSHFAGTLEIYAPDWRRFVSTVSIGVIVWLLIRFLKRMNRKIQHVSQILSPPKKERPNQKGHKEWKRWEEKIEHYKKWACSLTSHAWYYFQTIAGAICGYILGVLTIDPKIGWVGGNILTELYLRIWYVFLGFLVGGSLFFMWGVFWAIRKYCKNVISHEDILPLDPDRTGGLRELGRLALDLDLIVALPSIVFPLYLLTNPELPISIENAGPWILISIAYALVLIFMFFVSISPAHDDMVTAKTNYLLKIHREYKDMHKKIVQKLEPEELIEPGEYKRLSGLYELYDRVESMAVWPLDFQTTLRFSITSLLPLISVGISISISV